MSNNKAKLQALLKLINSAAQEAIEEYEKVGGDVPSIDSPVPHPLDNEANQVVLKSAIRILEGACAQLCTTLAPPSHTAINLVQVHDFACFRIVVRENITDILTDYPNGIHVNELSKIVKIEPKKLARVLRLLVTRGCYSEVDTDTFANNRLSLIFHSENSVRNIVHLHESFIKGDLSLYETLKDPKTGYSDDPDHAPLIYAYNKEGISTTFFDWIKQDDTRRKSYDNCMRGFNRTMGSLATLTQFPFEKYSTIVDVGGGIGSSSLPLAKMHKHITITLHDLPEALDRAREVWGRDYPEVLEENRVEFAKLDFFTEMPAKGKDVYYLRNIVHNWPDEKATIILRNVRKAMGPHSRLLIHDYVLLELSRKAAEAEGAPPSTNLAPEPLLANFGVGNIRMHQLDLTMLIIHNAKERTLQEFLKLAVAADLKLENVWDVAEACVIEFSATQRNAMMDADGPDTVNALT